MLSLGDGMLISSSFRTPNKTKLGANAILGVSLAVAKAGAAEKVRCHNMLAIVSCRLTLLEGNSSLRPRIRSYWDQETIRPPRPIHECCGTFFSELQLASRYRTLFG